MAPKSDETESSSSGSSRFIAHVVLEVLAIVAMGVYFHSKATKQEKRISRLVRVVEDQGNRLDYIDSVLRGILSSQPSHVQAAITRELSINKSPLPKRIEVRSSDRERPAPARPPPPPPPNPMESVMNMIGPLMSSLVVGMDEPAAAPQRVPSPPVRPARRRTQPSSPVIVEVVDEDLDRDLDAEIQDLKREEKEAEESPAKSPAKAPMAPKKSPKKTKEEEEEDKDD